MSGPEDPPRWSEDGAAPPNLSKLFSAARRDGATDQELAALGTRLNPLLAGPVAPVDQTTTLLSKLGVGALVAGVVIGGALYVRARVEPSAATPPPQKNAQTAGSAEIERSTAEAARPSDTPSVPQRRSSVVDARAASEASVAPAVGRKAPVPGSAPPNSMISARAEATLLERARGALASNPGQALALTHEHAAEFPHGLLSQEREVIAISALRRLGRGAEADRRAAHFDKLYPDSAHQQSVDSATRQ